MRTLLIFLCCIIFICHSEVLALLFPETETDWDVFEKYYYAKDIVNELLFTLLFLFATLVTKGLKKGFAMFGFVVTFASFIDKAFLGVFNYLYTDILLLIFATCIGFVVYKKTK